MKTGFLFAGQGSQHVGMGADFYEEYPAFREIFDLLPEQQKNTAFQGPMEELAATVNTQPIMVAFAAGVDRLLAAEGIRPAMAAGLSLGEYSALCSAGVFTPEQAVKLVSRRAEAMAAAAEGVDCLMAAVMGADRETVERCCRDAEDRGLAQICNLNCPGQIVIGGDKAAVEKACSMATAAGAGRCIPLKVSGPFHTAYMEPAGRALAELFRNTEFSNADFPVIFNCLGRAAEEGENVAELLVRQVSSRVLFEDTIRYMAEHGVDTIIEIGPGKALSSFVRKTAKNIEVMNIDTAADFRRVTAILKGEDRK
jgi:[acyl-carrier-protein] S-malonyltransferase